MQSRAGYLDIMEMALEAYSPETLSAAIPPEGGLLDDIHTCARVASVIGILLSHGRAEGYRGIWVLLMNALMDDFPQRRQEQSAGHEFPYGGRSNQYLFNEAYSAAIFEYEAARHRRLGDEKAAGQFKRAARLSMAALGRWLNGGWRQRLKNFYPVSSHHGCEGYGYYAKYMITLACFARDKAFTDALGGDRAGASICPGVRTRQGASGFRMPKGLARDGPL